jgi:hypothetical protein
VAVVAENQPVMQAGTWVASIRILLSHKRGD